jgi:diguanylate cyclase (GGDEF)-like protein
MNLDTIINFFREFEDIPIPIILKDSSFKWLYCNQEIKKLYNLNSNSYIGKTSSGLSPIKSAEYAENSDKLAVKSKKTIESHEIHFNRLFKVYKTPIYENENLIFIIVIAIEITDLENSKNIAIRLKDFYKALTKINQIIIKNPTPQILCDNVCSLIGELTQVSLLWVGKIDKTGKSLKVISQYRASKNSPDVKKYFISIDPSNPYGKGPAALSARTGKVKIVEDVFSNEGLKPWWDVYKKNQIKSMAAFPIKKFGEVEYVLVIYIDKKDFFNEELISLFKEISLDMGFSFEEYEKNEQISYLSLYDQLTGLANRNLFIDRLDQAINRAKRENTLVAVLILDISEFSSINKKFSHKVGDIVLKELSNKISSVLRQKDIARIGSDEFGIIFQNLDDVSELNPFLDRLDNIFDNPIIIKNNDIKIDYHMGISIYPIDGKEYDILLRRAGLALNQVKTNKDLRRQFFEKSLEEEFEKIQNIQRLFLKALDEDKIVAYYQPQIDIISGKIVGFEALARLNTDNGIIQPVDFISFIETKMNLVSKLDERIIDIAIKDSIKFQNMGLDVPISINIGAKHLMNPEFIPNLKKIILNAKDAFKSIRFEITEVLYLENTKAVQEILDEIKKLRFLISVDDFGTGYASFNYIKNIPIDQIKLDISFIRNLIYDDKNLAIVVGIITAAKMLELDIIAEGVESFETAALLKSIGCDTIQGFIIAEPMPIEELYDWYENYEPPEKLVTLTGNNRKIQKHINIIEALRISLYHSLKVYQIIEVLNPVNLNKNRDLKNQQSTIFERMTKENRNKTCELGKWYNKIKYSPLYKDNPVFLELGKKHEEIHLLSKELLLKNQPIAQKERKKLLDLSDETINLIWKLTLL